MSDFFGMKLISRLFDSVIVGRCYFKTNSEMLDIFIEAYLLASVKTLPFVFFIIV